MRGEHGMKLKQIDLSKAHEHEHPDIKLDRWYLAEVRYPSGKSMFAAGKFTRQWYGLNFQAFYDAGKQFDAPGFNSSSWVNLWQLVIEKKPSKRRRKRVKKCD
jgi:hypothetical protein